MSNDKTGGPAFPRPYSFDDQSANKEHAQDGMTLRDYFAAKAPDYTEQWFNNYVGNHGFRNCAEARAAWNYEYADAMLEARKS